MIQVPLVGTGDSIAQIGSGSPTDLVQATYIEKLLRRAIRLGGILTKRALVPHCSGDEHREIVNRQILANSDIDG